MNRTRYIPAIVMLVAALVACLTTMYFKYTTKDILLIVLATGVVFFIIGQVIRKLAEKYLVLSSMEETLTENGEVENQDNSEHEPEDEKSQE